jgi:hypothetical protein
MFLLVRDSFGRGSNVDYQRLTEALLSGADLSMFR